MAARHRRTLGYVLAILGVVALGVLVTAQYGDQETIDTSVSAAAADQQRGAAARPTPGPPPTGEIASGTFREIAAAQMPMVVSIRTLTQASMPASDLFGNDALRRFFGLPDQMPRERVLEGAGSGFVIDSAERLILTNNHVIENASRIQVVLFPDPEAAPGETQEYEATVLGRDPLTDSALLQVTSDVSLPAAELGDSDGMRPGDWVMAIGNPFGLSHTVTVGVISATSRPFPLEGRLQRVLQTDAAVNPGNSGGPLLNVRGKVIGMNTAIISPTGGGNVGIGFAVPINLVRELIPQLRQGDVSRGRIGVQIRPVPANAREALGVASGAPGALVAAVEPDGPAEQAGIRPGDVIVAFDGEPIDSPDELVDLVSRATPGTQAAIHVVRNGQQQQLTITPDALTLTDSPRRGGGGGPEQSPEGFGLTIAPITPDIASQLDLDSTSGAVVTGVAQGSAAAEAGVQPGDVILEVNREPVDGVEDAASRLRNVPAGGTTFLLVQREGQQIFLVMTRGEG